jgi:hypothetical protein
MEDQNNSNRGELSRRRLLRAGAYAAGAVALIGAASTAATAQVAKKAAQKDAGYQDSPMGGKSCGNCRQFQPPSSCTTVEGSVSANGYCRLYAKKG